MRQFLFDAFHHELLKALAASTDPRVAEIAAKAAKEVAYHLERSSDLVIRLGDGTRREPPPDAGRARRPLALHRRDVPRRRRRTPQVAAAGIVPDPASLRPAWERDRRATC